MHLKLTEEQANDLREIQAACERLNTEYVIIGATAFQLYFPDENRFTADIDLVVALGLEQFAEFVRHLQMSRWTQDPHREHRWRSGRASYFDILPAGPELRAVKQIVWPKSGFVMNLVGFDHVFAKSELRSLDQGFSIKITPPLVLAFLKMVSFMDQPYQRAKDLVDIRSLLARYEEDSARRFDDVVFDAKLSDFSFVNAFLLGLDLAKLCSTEEGEIVQQFIARFADDEDSFAACVTALNQGFLQEN